MRGDFKALFIRNENKPKLVKYEPSPFACVCVAMRPKNNRKWTSVTCKQTLRVVDVIFLVLHKNILNNELRYTSYMPYTCRALAVSQELCDCSARVTLIHY